MLVFAVPGLLVAVLGYVVGYVVIEWFIGATGVDLPPSAPEVGGWISGIVLLVVVTAVLALVPWRRRRAARRHRGGGRQK